MQISLWISVCSVDTEIDESAYIDGYIDELAYISNYKHNVVILWIVNEYCKLFDPTYIERFTL